MIGSARDRLGIYWLRHWIVDNGDVASAGIWALLRVRAVR